MIAVALVNLELSLVTVPRHRHIGKKTRPVVERNPFRPSIPSVLYVYHPKLFVPGLDRARTKSRLLSDVNPADYYVDPTPGADAGFKSLDQTNSIGNRTEHNLGIRDAIRRHGG